MCTMSKKKTDILVKRHWFVLGKDITYAYTITRINRSTLFAVNDDRKVSVRASPAETDRSFFCSRNRTAKIMSQRWGRKGKGTRATARYATKRVNDAGFSSMNSWSEL